MKYRFLVCACTWVVLAGCARTAEIAAPAVISTAAAAEALPAKDTALPNVVVYKSATCGCCRLWVDHMRQHGFAVEVHDVDNLGPIKERVGLPYAMGSCHTAEVDGYFVEGHVPAEQVLRMLKEKPAAKGLAVPGMPIGSPGMEQGTTQQPYDVQLVHQDGTSTVYAKYPKR